MSTTNLTSRPIARKFVPTPEQKSAMDSAERSSDWFWQLPPTELGKYANQSVAIYECQVVAVAPTLSELIPKIVDYDVSRTYVVRFPLSTPQRCGASPRPSQFPALRTGCLLRCRRCSFRCVQVAGPRLC